MKRRKMKKVMSGFMAVLTMTGSLLSPLTSFATELPETETKPPLLNDVKDLLDEKEIVKAYDLGIDLGIRFDVKTDFTDIDIPDNEWVKVSFEEAKNSEGEEFTTDKLDIYEAVYYVEPLMTDHPKYQVNRKLIVKEPGTEIHTDNMPPETEAETVMEEEETQGVEEDPQGEEDLQVVEEVPAVMENVETYDSLEDIPAETAAAFDEMETLFSESQVVEEEVVVSGTEEPEDYLQEVFFEEEQDEAPDEMDEIIYSTPDVETYETAGENVETEVNDDMSGCETEHETNAETIQQITENDESEALVSEKTDDEELVVSEVADFAEEEIQSMELLQREEEESNLTENTLNIPVTQEETATEERLETVTEITTAVEAAEDEITTESQEELMEYPVKEFKARLKIVKQDSDTGRTILIPNTEFKVYDMDKQAYVEQVTSYPDYYTHTSYFTDDQGFLIMPRSLRSGNYRIEEVTAPVGYVRSDHFVQVQINAESAFSVDEATGDNVIEVHFENNAVKSKMNIRVQGEVVSGYQDGNFTYEMTKLPNAEFDIIAAEDIYTSDFQKDDDGNRFVAYAAGIPVTTITTDANGMAVVENLPLGSYEIREKNVPSGYVKTDISKTITFEYTDQNTAVIEQDITFTCERQKLELTAIQLDAENDSTVEGAVLGLYSKNDMKKKDGTVILPADSLIEEKETGKDGKAVFKSDLPFGKYYVKELKEAAGYVSSDEIMVYEAANQNQETAVVKLQKSKKNMVTAMEFSAVDIDSRVVIGGAHLILKNKDGKEITDWTSSKDQSLTIKRLKAGETYILHEEMAPYGYLRIKDLEFKVENTGDVQKVTIEHTVPTALLIINARGEFLSSVKANENASELHYESGSITKVTFEVYAQEDIKAADGESSDYFKSGDHIATIETDENGIAQLGDLPVGKYYVIEKETAAGYLLDAEPRTIDLSYRDQDTPVVTYNEEWQNTRQRLTVEITNKEKKSGKALSGAVFGLYSAEDIKSESGKILIRKDQLIERRATDKQGVLLFTADVPVNNKYYVKEIQAADGYVTTDQMNAFTFNAGQDDEDIISYKFTVENEKTHISLVLKMEGKKENITGASMRVTDESGDVVEKWITDAKAHDMEGLTVGKTYTLTQKKPAPGYVSTADVKFKVENKAEVQMITMVGDVTKLSISKTDASGNGQVAGAKLVILDKNDKVVESWTSESKEHYVEKLPVGSYMIREEQAAKGYVIRSDVKFDVADSAKLQMVSMSNETAKGKVILNLSDDETGRPLMGAEFELRDSSGNMISVLKTDAAGHAESKLVEIASYKNGTFGSTLIYHLVQTKNLEGYLLDSTDREIKFEYVDQNKPIIEVTVEVTNVVDTKNPHIQGTETKVSDNPQTGDTTNLWIPIIMMLASISLVAGILFGRKKLSN